MSKRIISVGPMRSRHLVRDPAGRPNRAEKRDLPEPDAPCPAPVPQTPKDGGDAGAELEVAE